MLVAIPQMGWAQFGFNDIGSMLEKINDPQNWYYVSLTATNSTTSGGSGQVKLMACDLYGNRIYDQYMIMGLSDELKEAVWPDGNPQADFARTLTQNSFSLIYMPGVELEGGGMMLSSYAYFAGWAKADDGSYFAGWSYTDGGTDLGKAGAEADYETETIVEDEKSKEVTVNNYALFKILPNNKPGYLPTMGTHRTVYATFLPVQLTDYTSYMGQVEAREGDQVECTVEVKVKGKDIDEADFNNPVITGEGWAIAANAEDGYEGWEYDPEIGVVFIDVVFTAPEEVAIGDEYCTTLTFSTKSGSTIMVPVSVRAVDPARQEATLKIGETEQEGSWTDMLSAANAAAPGESVVLTLNRDVKEVQESQMITRSMTINPNGYVLQSSSVVPITVNGGIVTIAYSKYEGGVNGNGDVAIHVAAGELILEGGYINGDVRVAEGAKLTQNGAWIDGTIINAGTTIVKDGNIRTDNKDYAIQSTGNLTIDGGDVFAANTAVYVEDGSALLKKGLVHAYDMAVLSEGNTTIEKLAELVIEVVDEEDIPESPARRLPGDEPEEQAGIALLVKGGTTTVNCGKFDAPTPFDVDENATLNFVSGFFRSVDGLEIPAGKKVWNLTTGPEFRDDYIYFVGDDDARLAAGVAICTIGNIGYTTLEDALAYANNNKEEALTIVLKGDYTLPAGFFTLPANATLLIPFEESQESGYELITRIAKNSVTQVDYIRPFEYRRLTMSEGAHLDVFGTVEISGRQFASDEAYAAVPYAGYGLIYMSEGASITMQGGSEMRAWGYMIGKGEMDVRRGATVREQFQMGDWKGGTTSMNMLSDPRHVFPLTQYYIQSIESPVKYHAGAVLSTATSVSAALGGLPIVATANDIKIVGIDQQDDAMFLMSMADDEENTWVRKWYDIENDIQTYEVYSSASIGSMVLDLGQIGGQDLQMHSGAFNLPITNNMKIHLLYGYMDFTQNTEMLPGAEVEIDKESTVAIVKNRDENNNINESIVSGSLYIYDAEDWDTYAYDGNGLTQTKVVKYSPSWFAKNGTGTPTARDLNHVEDAKINVHGTFDTTDGYVFTSAHGANIFSTNGDAGTFTFTAAAKAEGYKETVYQVRGRTDYQYREFTSAQLKNAEGQEPAFATTAGTEAGKSYCYINNRWTLMDIDVDDPNFMIDNYGDYYAKPNAYVPVSATKVDGAIIGNADHTYSGKYEQDRLFILTEEGQWWEVTIKDNLYYCADNDMYYVYDDSYGWQEKKFTITWQNWDGSPLTTYNVPYGTMAEYRSTNPERVANVDYTYDFTGWSPALGKVTTDVTYTATFTSKQRQYTIIFQTEGGAEIERQFLVRDEFPVCENEPSKPGHILKWQPALAAVTGNATYTATWLEEKPATWNIRFVNYNGTPVGEADGYDVEAGTMPEAPATPFKPATDEFTYNFIGWKPALENASRDLTYTAQFEEVAKTYAITFTDENDNVLGSVQNLTYGAAPEVPNYTKEATAQYTYTIDWTPKVVAVSGDQTYKADVTAITNKYTVTCYGEGCVFTGAGVYEYGAMPTITVAADSKYENAAWVSGPEDGFTVTGDVIFTASATLKQDETPKYESLTLAANAVVDKAGATEQLMNLTLTSDGSNSADLRNAQNLTIFGQANFDLVQSMAARTWYAVAVPWEVNADNGVLTLGGQLLKLGTDIDIVYYDGAERAAKGASDDCWKYVELSGDHILRPGVFYMAYLLNAQSGLRFQKKAGASLHYAGEVLVAPHDAAVSKDANWNGIANPATYHATLETGATEGQFYSGEGYDMISLASKEFIVGQPVFVQVPDAQSVVVNAASAPMRVQAAPAERYDVQLAANGTMADHIFVATEADKADEYVIVKDLVKMGVSTKKAQMWVNRYDAKLCVNTMEENENGNAFPLSIYAPQSASYELSVAPNDAEKVVYLTKDGVVIWNLTDAPYALNLQQGTTAEYGLLISRRMPATPTALDGTNGNEQIFKYIDNNHVYILRQGKVYTVSGQLVK